MSTPPPIAVATLPPRPPELVILDLDGTCVDVESGVHRRTVDAVRAAATRTLVVVASGRMFCATQPWTARFGLTTPVICYQGALIRHQTLPARGSAIIAARPLAGSVALNAIDVARRHNWHRQAYVDDRLLCEEDRPEAHLYARISGVDINYVDDLRVAARDGSTKVTCVVEGEVNARQCEEAMRDALGAAATTTRSLPQLVEITDPGATKGQAVRHLCAYLGVAIGHAVAIGDAPNDIDMLAAVGFGVAVEGARPAVMEVAAATCAPPRRAGVADVLEVLGLC